MRRVPALLLLLLSLLAACGPADPVPTATPVPVAAALPTQVATHTPLELLNKPATLAPPSPTATWALPYLPPTVPPYPTLEPKPTPWPAIRSTGIRESQIVTVAVHPLPDAAADITAYDFADAQHGWLAVESRLFATRDGGQHWTVQYNAEVGLNGVSFISPQQGWISGGGGFWMTQDGGTTWTALQNDLPLELRSLRFADAGHAWAGVLDKGLIVFLHTSDGGRHWMPAPNPCPQDESLPSGQISFINPTVGWALCAGQPSAGHEGKSLFQTLDGGHAWHLVTQTEIDQYDTDGLPSGGYANGIFFADTTHGWLTEARGGLLATRDGGVHWAAVPFPGDGAGFFAQPLFRSPQQGWVLSWYRGYTILAKVGGGNASWQQLYPTLSPTGPVQFFDAYSGVGIGTRLDPAVVLRTADSGRTWSPVGTLPLSNGTLLDGCLYPYSVSFSDAKHGWVTGDDCSSNPISSTTLYHTDDGGHTWTRISSCPSCRLITALDATTAYAVTSATASLVVTHDGGATFQPVPTKGLHGAGLEIQFANPARGWELAEAHLFQTADGGYTWTPIPLAYQVRDFRLLADGHAWVLGDDCGDAHCSLLSTADWGSTWTLYAGLPNWAVADVQPLTFTDAQHGWLATIGGHLWATADSGLTWNQVR